MESKVISGSTAVEAVKSSIIPVKKIAKSKAKMQRAKASHPPTSEMVKAAIKELKDRKGSSLQAIKKYITATYKIDGEKAAPFIKRYLKSALTSGAVVQTKGKGASGSFKLPVSASESKVKLPLVQKKNQARTAKSPVRKPAVKKAANLKKAPAAGRKPPAVKKEVKSVSAIKMKAKPISKAKKTAKAPAAKTRTPKPKKVAAAKTRKVPARK